MSGCISFTFPRASLRIGYVMKPMAIPVAILPVTGMVKITKKAGNDSSNGSHLMWRTCVSISDPTIIKAGAVIAETPETEEISGLKKAEQQIRQRLQRK